MMVMLAVLALALAEPPAADPAPVPNDPASSLAGLQQMYDQSCAAREYGAYDDLCDQLAQQLKATRAEADRDARRKAAEARRHPRTAPVAPPPASHTPAAAPPFADPSPRGR